MKRIFITFALLVAAVGLCSAAPTDSVAKPAFSYVPQFGGAIRARWEMETDGGLNRFMLRNARVNVAGRMAEPIDYYLQVDLCDCGKMKFLDGWVRLELFKGFKLQGGQFRMPFGIDTFRAPGNYIFANRSFIGRDMCNYRAVGAKFTYAIPRTPLTVEAGAFNPGTITDHTPWTHQKAYAGKVLVKLGDFQVEGGVLSNIPDSVRINMLDAAVIFRRGGLHAEAEYLYEHYTGSAYRPCHGVVAWADYAIPVRAGMFNQCSFQGRFDVMTDHSNGTRNAAGHLITNDPARRRITLGATISRIMGSRHCDFRINYEKYFYNSGVTPPAGRGDKVVAELVLKF